MTETKNTADRAEALSSVDEIDRLANFILKMDIGHPVCTKQKPNGESAVDSAISIIMELMNKIPVPALCHGVHFGSYENQVTVTTPQGKQIGIDICMIPEIKWLWDMGVETIECCCGHRIKSGYVAVREDSREKMNALGYKPDPKAPHCYLAKSALSAPTEWRPPEGYKLVPIEPTVEMNLAGSNSTYKLEDEIRPSIAEVVYKAMLSAAPSEVGGM